MAEKSRLSPLHLTVHHGHKTTIETLLSHGADTGFLGVFDRSVLFKAVRCGRIDVFKILLERARLSLTTKDEFHYTPLSYAATRGDKTAVHALLRMGAHPCDGEDLSAKDIGWLPLTGAASRGRTECARILLDHGADPNQPGPNQKNTALYYAAVKSFPDTLRVLLDRGADTNHPLLRTPILVVLAKRLDIPGAAKIAMMDMVIEFRGKVDAADDEGMTALMHAILAKDQSVVAHLLERGASLDSKDNHKRSALHFASYCSSEGLLKMILAKDPELGDLDHSGCSSLSYSVEHANMAGILLNHGVKPDLAQYEGYTALMFAAMEGYSETVKLLLSHHADANLRAVSNNGTGATALSWAVVNDNIDIVNMLADAGPDLSYKYGRGATILHQASVAVARVLLQYRKRLNIDATDVDGLTPLHAAIYLGKGVELVKLFVDDGANLQALDDQGHTPLGAAARQSDHKALKLLLQEEDCDPRIAARRGRSPLHWAVRAHETIESVQLLVERGADVNQIAKSGVGSPLQMACKNKKKGKEMIDYLLKKKADVHAQGGTLGFAISAAAMHGTLEIITLLLENEATVNVTDAMGRKPIHVSCVNDVENFHRIYKAGGNQHLQEKDNLGRTVCHWAAQHGRPEILEKLIAELGTSLLDEPDVDGWTCLPHTDSNEDADESRRRRLRVFQILTEQGARPDKIGKIGESCWSLRDIMVYNDADQKCLELVDEALATDQPPAPPPIAEAGQACRIGALKSEGGWECDACCCVSIKFLNFMGSLMASPDSFTSTLPTIPALCCQVDTDLLLFTRASVASYGLVQSATWTSATNATGTETSFMITAATGPSGRRSDLSSRRIRRPRRVSRRVTRKWAKAVWMVLKRMMIWTLKVCGPKTLIQAQIDGARSLDAFG